MGEFIKPVKSTIDFLGYTIGTNYLGDPVQVIDMDSDVNIEEILTSDDPAILWEMSTISEAPIAPLWAVAFLIGAKTTKDNAGTERMSLLEAVKKEIGVNNDIEVRDYTGAAAGPKVGILHITSVDMEPAQGDRFSGMRLIAVQARGMEI